ncbi:ribonuclease R [Mergibacter septicus]|uniref:ribonuclease R n=1 Tax=Mergibacter septicus TaxID=221402 RepID=UPI001C77AE6D|nr:ribonuclease R [Mergibacter septicus]QDJ13825.1 ribonuclease R [Mergibacter septicus]
MLKYQDPNYAEEVAKYGNPIPSRELILSTIQQRNSLSREEIQAIFHLKNKEQQEAMRRRLRAMENCGQLILTKRKRYALPETQGFLKGTVLGHRDGYGFLQVEGRKDDYFIPNIEMQKVLDGDQVLAQLKGTDKRGRQEIRIKRIIESRKKHIVGRFFSEDGIGYVVPDDSRINQDILIPNEARLGARMGQVVVVELTPRRNNHKLIGTIIEVLGDNLAKGMEVEIALRDYEIPHSFSETVQQEITYLSEEVPESAKKGRVDLRQLPLVTIDGEDARDFDDAVYCQANPNGGWTLWVAIADVSYYVRPKTALDSSAYQRGNSVYFPNRVIPMLPEKLSNGLCSLNPQVDRLCLVCEMTISTTGKITGYQFYQAVMNSHARLTYNKVWKILQGDEALSQRYQHLVPHLNQLYQMFKVLQQAKQQRGAIEFETIETKFIFNTQGRIERIEPLKRNDAHRIIEECMILANIAAANFVASHQVPALFRIHAQPSEEKLTSFKDFLRECGLTLSGGLQPSPSDYAQLMEKVQNRPDKELIQTMLLRSLSQAVYSADNIGHFGLALKEYAHFTSPIRRYPDLSLHRTIKALLAKQTNTPKLYQQGGAYHYNLEQIDQLGEHCSMTERRADDATRDVADWLKCEFMQDHVGEIFSGTISSVTGFGFFVRLDDLFIDGLVHISTLTHDYYRFDPAGQRLIGESSGMLYRLGDPVKIKVVAVNLEQRTLDFNLISSERSVRRKGKTAREKNKKYLRQKQNKNGKKSRTFQVKLTKKNKKKK